MLDIFLCIRDDHDFRFVLLAAGVCLLSAVTAVLMIRQSTVSGAKAVRWTVMGGFSTGFGIWATHFIAMLGYDPGFIAGYQASVTVSSLAIVLTATIAALVVARTRPTRGGIAVAAIIFGSGFATMHYVGMAALEMPAVIRWQRGFVALSLVLAIVPLYPALTLAVHGQRPASGPGAALLMTAAVVGLHFSGMTAMQLIPSRMDTDVVTWSPTIMSSLIGVGSMGLLAMCIGSWMIARRTGAAIAASERQLSVLVKGISDCAIYMVDREGRVANWNAGAQRLKGYSVQEAVGLPLAAFYSPEDRAAGAPARALATAHDEGKFTGQGWRLRKDGSRFWAHVTVERIHDDEGRHLGYAKITRDMTRFKEDQDRIQETSGNLDAALEHMDQGLCLFNADQQLVLRNRRFAELWNLPEDACLPGTSLQDMARAALRARTGRNASAARLDRVQALLRESLDDPHSPPLIWEFGDQFVVAVTSRALPDGRWVTTFEDISERRRSEEQIAHMAMHDALTGLPNRAGFNRWLDKELDHAATRAHQLALVAIDLDGFKDVNDSQGHAAGDAVLVAVAEALSAAVDDGAFLARIGGDEFAVAKYLVDPADLGDFVARVNGCLARAEDGPIGASLGIAVYPSDATTREQLLNNADLAMHRAKSSLDEHICYYEPGMDERARRRRQMAADLRIALGRDEFTVLYQPQRSLKTNEICGYEALLRWHHPRLGTVSPAEFVPIAEETGEIMRLGEWVLRSACTEAARWDRPDKIAVNLSPVQLLRPDLPEVVANILVETGLAPRRLELEITETALISDKTRALHSLRRIKALGVSVAMDDFGTGYSSLDTLHSFPFDKIKIDKSFLLQAEQNDQARAIIRAVLALGRSLGIPVLAEGVETAGQLGLLMAEGCEEAQGYLFGRPAVAPSAAPQRRVSVQ